MDVLLFAEMQVPGAKTWLIVFGVLIVIILASKAGVIGGDSGNVKGTGRSFRCQRCGRDFQPEKVELLNNGEVRHFIDDRCPGCGWDKDYRDDNHDGRPDQYERGGGSSGSW